MRWRRKDRAEGDTVTQETLLPRRKRSWKSRLAEFALWAAVAIATALIMISMSETLLPTNF